MDQKPTELKDVPLDQQLEVIRKRYGLTGYRAEFALAIELGEIEGDTVAIDENSIDNGFLIYRNKPDYNHLFPTWSPDHTDNIRG